MGLLSQISAEETLRSDSARTLESIEICPLFALSTSKQRKGGIKMDAQQI